MYQFQPPYPKWRSSKILQISKSHFLRHFSKGIKKQDQFFIICNYPSYPFFKLASSSQCAPTSWLQLTLHLDELTHLHVDLSQQKTAEAVAFVLTQVPGRAVLAEHTYTC